MLVHPAEQSYQQGMELLSQGRLRVGLAFFGGAIEIVIRVGVDAPQARYLSFYGLCVSLTRSGSHEAIRCCRMAAKLEGYRPEVCWNLGKVLLAANRRREAHRALQWGLRMQPAHDGILRDLRKMGRRRRPPLPFLARDHKVNVWLGTIRAA